MKGLLRHKLGRFDMESIEAGWGQSSVHGNSLIGRKSIIAGYAS